MQKLTWRLCKIKPAEVLKMTIGDLDIVLEEGYQEFEENYKRHVDLKVAILNAPRSERKGGGLYHINDFLPKNMKLEKTEISADEQASLIMDRGRKLAEKCKQYTRRR
jgi:hypothetical protein